MKDKYLIIHKVIESINEEKNNLEHDLVKLHNNPESRVSQVEDIKTCLRRIANLDLILHTYVSKYIPEDFSYSKDQ